MLFKSKEHEKSFREVIMQLWNCPGQSLDIPRPAKVLTQLRTGITCKHPGGLYISQIWNTFEIVNISLLQKGCHFSCGFTRDLWKINIWNFRIQPHSTAPIHWLRHFFFFHICGFSPKLHLSWTVLGTLDLKPSIWECDMIYIRTFWNPFFFFKDLKHQMASTLFNHLFLSQNPMIGKVHIPPWHYHLSRHVWPKMGDVGTLWYQLGGHGAIHLKNFNLLVCGLLWFLFDEGSHSFLKHNKSHQPPCYHAPAFRTALMSLSRILLPTNLDTRGCL